MITSSTRYTFDIINWFCIRDIVRLFFFSFLLHTRINVWIRFTATFSVSFLSGNPNSLGNTIKMLRLFAIIVALLLYMNIFLFAQSKEILRIKMNSLIMSATVNISDTQIIWNVMCKSKKKNKILNSICFFFFSLLLN